MYSGGSLQARCYLCSILLIFRSLALREWNEPIFSCSIFAIFTAHLYAISESASIKVRNIQLVYLWDCYYYCDCSIALNNQMTTLVTGSFGLSLVQLQFSLIWKLIYWHLDCHLVSKEFKCSFNFNFSLIFSTLKCFNVV